MNTLWTGPGYVDGRPRLYADLDNTTADFDKSPLFDKEPIYDPPQMQCPRFFRNLPPVPGAIISINKLMHCGLFHVEILTKPLMDRPGSWTEKDAWITEYFPELIFDVTMTANKAGQSRPGAILIDDCAKIYKAPWEANGGRFVHFQRDYNWPDQVYVDQWEHIVSELIRLRKWELEHNRRAK